MVEDNIPGHENMSKYYFEKIKNCIILQEAFGHSIEDLCDRVYSCNKLILHLLISVFCLYY